MIRSQVVYSRLAAIVREMSDTVARTARSKGLAEGRRYAVAALTGAPRIAAQVQFDASHSYLIRASAAALIDYFAFDLADGDIVVVGDPYSGGSTPQVLTFLAPFFHEGELVLFPAIRAELADLAGEYPGTLHPTASETWQEAIRVTPVKLYRNGVLQRDILRFLLRNSRAADLVRSDIEAIVSALRAAGRNLDTLLRDRGRQAVEGAIDDAIDHGRRLVGTYLSRWNGMERAGATTIERIGSNPIALKLRLSAEGGTLLADFVGSNPQVAEPYNITRWHVRGYVLVAAVAEMLDDVALNDGVLDRLEVRAERGSIVDPILPSATGLSDLVTGHAVAGLVRAMLQGDGDGMAPIDGPAPAIVLFAPIGSREDNPPFALDPGFAISGAGWGSPVLAGHRLLPSAEILEARDGFEVLFRERSPMGAIDVLVRNRRGDLEAAAIVPQRSGHACGALVLVEGDRETPLDCVTGGPIPDGALLRFTYPRYAGDLDDET
ncbi:hydantoinase B/oxoprolinase family protein [Kaistia dalseonensis]|nr:hydantoinase B/oxoprolinase family protein [Kaistia dalseonensis]